MTGMINELVATDGDTELIIKLARKRFLLKSEIISAAKKEQYKKEILDTVCSQGLSEHYVAICSEFGWEVDQSQLEKFKAKTADELKTIEEKITDATENLGDTEVREALYEKAQFLCKIGVPKEERNKNYKIAEEKTIAIGHKLDMVFSQLIASIFDGDFVSMSSLIEKCKDLLEQGGDWERKNKLKVYEGVYLMATRSFKQAGELFLTSVATFTTTELFPYNILVLYTIITTIVSLDRVALKKKIVDAPEILTVIGEIPCLEQLLNSLYNCKYGEFFKALPDVADLIKMDMFLEPHHRYFLREIRIVVYSQFLESYKSVSLSAMAATFGLSVEFLTKELATFIVSGALNCKIDKVAGVVETIQPDSKNTLYQATIKKGDHLLNKIQKLGRVIDME